jgi:3-hydroxyisobutyrate dehydrogenase
MNVGFIGIGVMGQPMALNLLQAGVRLTVWNRTRSRCAPLAGLGAQVAGSPREVYSSADTVILMMFDEASTDAALERRTPAFEQNVRDHVIVQMGTMQPEYSRALETEVTAAGGHYVEAPVSGSRGPAEQGQLVAMVAGADPAVLHDVQLLLAPMCAATVVCGAVPAALSTKLAVNLYMIGMVTALAEAFNFATQQGLDLSAFAAVLSAGPMDSPLARVKAHKLLTADYDVQAAITDVVKNTDLVVDAARTAGIAAPIIDLCSRLYHEAADSGWGRDDMVAVIKTFAERNTTG